MTTPKRRGPTRGGKMGNGERMINETDLASIDTVGVMPEGGVGAEGGEPFGGMGIQDFSASPEEIGYESVVGEMGPAATEGEMPRGGMDATPHAAGSGGGGGGGGGGAGRE